MIFLVFKKTFGEINICSKNFFPQICLFLDFMSNNPAWLVTLLKLVFNYPDLPWFRTFHHKSMMSRQKFLIITRSIITLSLFILHAVTMHKQMKNGQVVVCSDNSKNTFCKQSKMNDISHTIIRLQLLLWVW